MKSTCSHFRPLAVMLFSAALLSFAQTTITFTEYPIPVEGYLPAITAGPDGGLWFPLIRCDYGCPSGTQNDSIGHMTTGGVFNQFELPALPGEPLCSYSCGSRPHAIAAGSDGALWFTELPFVNRIGRVTTAGAITQFELPFTSSPALSTPDAITAGPDGALWFIERGAWVVGRITTAGAVTSYPFPAIPYDAGKITTGPDGALWFTVFGQQAIIRMTPTGVFTTYPTGFDCVPDGITSGPDDALWFTCHRDHIGRISTSGVMSSYAVPTLNSWPSDITLGPDGALWFTEPWANQVGRITTAGIVTEYAFPLVRHFASTLSVATGPDGNLWFASLKGSDVVHPHGSLVKGVIGLADSSSPVITPRISGTRGNNGWFVSDVSVQWDVADPESGIATTSGCDPLMLTTDTTGVSLQCSATNGAGQSNSVSVMVKIDKTPPVISGMPGAGCSLWPPNNKLVEVAIVAASDATSGVTPGFPRLTGTSNQPTDPQNPDVVIARNALGGFRVQLRAARAGNSGNRIYTLDASATDLAGNLSKVESTCIVPHDQR